MTRKFDLIVVGAGSAGVPLAVRAAQTSGRSVLLLEAGRMFNAPNKFPRDVLDASTYSAMLPGNPSNWSLTANLTDKISAPVARGKIVGGSSAINGMIFLRGTRQDFDGWARLGNVGWSYDDVLPYFKQIESDRDFPNSPNHGSDGPIPVTRGLHGPKHPSTEAFFSACADLGYAYTEDKNSPDSTGYGLLPLNVSEGVRVSTALAYLCRSALPENLTIQADTLVHRVEVHNGSVTGVRVEHAGNLEIIHADEVILCAGALKTPQILMLSGIGPSGQLAQHNIPVVHHAPGVGQGMADHPELFVSYEPGCDVTQLPGSRIVEASLSFTSSVAGAYDDLEINAMPAPISKVLRPSLKGLGAGEVLRRGAGAAASIAKVSPSLLWQQAKRRNDLSLAVTVMQHDECRGTVQLRSANPRDDPKIHYHYLESESDMVRAREGLQAALAVVGSQSFGPIAKARTSPGTDFDRFTRAETDAWIRGSLATAFHSCRSARMGTPDDAAAVVDQECRVYGIEGLRVADTSIFPAPLSRGPNNTAIMIGERVADFLQK